MQINIRHDKCLKLKKKNNKDFKILIKKYKTFDKFNVLGLQNKGYI